ncbi:MAG: hypothetical protein RBT05_03715 [Bacteroidales bacterium]|jgi:hypothetical protein|nr:hypothetical protein [Bacteroidales bacterium]
MKFYEDMPAVEAKDDLLVMVGDVASPNQPRRITFAKIKAYVKLNWTINFGDLGQRPKINGVELKGGDNTLSELSIQPSGNYVPSDTSTHGEIDIDITNPDLANYVIRAKNEASGEAKIRLLTLFNPIKEFEVVDRENYLITHELGENFYPTVVFIEDEKNEIVPITVAYTSSKTIDITWEGVKTGKIILKF